MTELALRYFEKEDLYLLEIRDSAYFELDRKLRKVSRQLERADTPAERAVLECRRAALRYQRQNAQKYVGLAPGDVPDGVRARPLHRLPDTITLPPERYRELVAMLCRKRQGP